MAATTTLRVVFVGDPAIGKMSAITRIACNYYTDDPYPTIHEVLYKEHTYMDKDYKIGLWVTAGHDEYDALRLRSYPFTNMIAICFAASSPPSFEHVRTKWLPEITQHAPNVPFILICTRIDTREDDSIVYRLQQKHGRGCITTGEGRDLAAEIGALHYFETSASTGEGFSEIVDKVLESQLDRQNNRKAGCILL